MFQVPEVARLTSGVYGSPPHSGNNGGFLIPLPEVDLTVIASDGLGWEHVSVSVWTKTGDPANRCPSWEEMDYIRNLFWEAQALVVQFHPPKTEKVNFHPFCLHLWRRPGWEPWMEVPPWELVGPRG